MAPPLYVVCTSAVEGGSPLFAAATGVAAFWSLQHIAPPAPRAKQPLVVETNTGAEPEPKPEVRSEFEIEASQLLKPHLKNMVQQVSV